MEQALGQTQPGQQFFGALAGPGGRNAGDQLRQDDVFQRVEFRQQMVELIDETDIAATDGRAGPIVQITRRLSPHPHFAGIRTLQQSGRMQQGGLAGAGRSDKPDNLARCQRQAGAPQHGQLAGLGHIGAFDGVEFEDEITHSAAPPPDRDGPLARLVAG